MLAVLPKEQAASDSTASGDQGQLDHALSRY